MIREENEKLTLNLSISIWLMSSDWGRNLSATRLRRAGGLSVSSGISSVSWDSELSPPPITPLPLPPVNAPPDTIYVIRVKHLRYLFPLYVNSFSPSRATRTLRGRLSRPEDVWRKFERLRDASRPRKTLLFHSEIVPIFQSALRRHSNISWTSNGTCLSTERRENLFLSLSFSFFHFLTSICIPLSPLLHLAFRAALLPFFLSLLLLQTSGPNLSIFD